MQSTTREDLHLLLKFPRIFESLAGLEASDSTRCRCKPAADTTKHHLSNVTSQISGWARK